MKKLMAIVLLFLLCSNSFSQTTNGDYNTNYTFTVFEDNFNGSSINRANWEPGLIKRGIGQLIDSSLTHNVSNGKLELSMFNIPNYNNSVDYVGSEFSTKKTFLYGIFECEASFAGEIGSWPAFWSFHRLKCPNNEGPEIDFAEYFCETLNVNNRLGHYIHHWKATPCGQEGGGKYPTIYKSEYNFSATTNHYKCIWTPDKIEIYVDHVLKATFNKNGTDWFPSDSVSVILSQQILQPYNYLGQPINPICPQTSYFDRVLVKEFFSSPEITCTKLICTTGSSSLNVDQRATNISWTLSPAVLFSGDTNGTGTSATITAANNMRGEGKITYTFDMPSGESFDIEETFWVGKPDIFLDYGYITSGDGGDGYVCTDQTGNEIDLSYYNEKENGNCDNYEIKLTNISGSQIIDQFYTSNGIADLDYSNLSEGFYLLYVRAHNTCGWSEWVDTEIEFIDCSAMFLMFTPNPATDETTLSIESTSGEEEFKSESYIWDIEIYDSNQIMKEKKLKIKGKEYKLNTADWKEGVYFARAKLKDKIISGQLVVNK